METNQYKFSVRYSNDIKVASERKRKIRKLENEFIRDNNQKLCKREILILYHLKNK